MSKATGRKKSRNALLGMTLGLIAAGCAGSQPPIEPVDHVELKRFMGDWYVIASIPTFLEKDAYNAVENYALNDDGSIATTFTFRKGSFDGKKKIYTPTGFVTDTDSNAVWGMRFVWPIKADYRIAYLDEGYSRTIIARNKRDYVWIMARNPTIADSEYDELVRLIDELGYDTSKLRKVPHLW
ncbi:MAG: lipocalin family protein [Gammaproteobacteria bacterium]|nr:lipocalin family protein [Gammaproteobacteria bacterium]MDH4314875.1 lipocalin family protein [Gammaproteobacteria bacterium]MDH5213787.1 lipocalin family protein [Gammaproteobacteria bacterium]MDH5501362.1 lipocalin family protein [Gammaproteobacteria bacterium]